MGNGQAAHLKLPRTAHHRFELEGHQQQLARIRFFAVRLVKPAKSVQRACSGNTGIRRFILPTTFQIQILHFHPVPLTSTFVLPSTSLALLCFSPVHLFHRRKESSLPRSVTTIRKPGFQDSGFHRTRVSVTPITAWHLLIPCASQVMRDASSCRHFWFSNPVFPPLLVATAAWTSQPLPERLFGSRAHTPTTASQRQQTARQVAAASAGLPAAKLAPLPLHQPFHAHHQAVDRWLPANHTMPAADLARVLQIP